MTFNKLTSGISVAINRTIQKAEESFKASEKTPIATDIELLSNDCGLRHNWASALLRLTEAVIEPNIANRAQDVVLGAIDRKSAHVTELEDFGEQLVRMGEHLDPNSSLGATLIKCGQCESATGKASRNLQQTVESTYLKWLRNYLQNTCKPALAKFRELENLRLDLDRAKAKLKHAEGDAAKKQKYEQASSQAQIVFDRYSEEARQKLSAAVAEFDQHKDALLQFMNAQLEYHQDCLKSLQAALN